MVFECKKHKCLQQPHVCLNNNRIDFVDRVKYLGVVLQGSLKDDADIQRQIRSLYCAANKLRTTFHKCSTPVKNIFYRAYCTPMYACQLWNKHTSDCYNRLRVAYNNAFRIIHRIPRNVSARHQQVIDGIVTFDALIRKNLFSFVQRCTASSNQCLKAIMQSDCFCKSSYVIRYNSLLYSAEMAE